MFNTYQKVGTGTSETSIPDEGDPGRRLALRIEGDRRLMARLEQPCRCGKQEITMSHNTQTQPAFVRAANLETSMMYMGSIMSFLVRGQDADGRFAMVEYRARPGNEPPPHVHLWEHEIFHVLEGQMEFHCEDQVKTVGAGETIFLPKGKAHAFYIRSAYLRTLIMALATTDNPVALDSYFAGMAGPATSMDIPVDAITYLLDDPSHAIEAGARYGIKMLSAEETKRALPHFGGLGANLGQAFDSNEGASRMAKANGEHHG
jgi:quercetin dioxygenase-like cupin family protein